MMAIHRADAWSTNSVRQGLSPGHSDSEEISGPYLVKIKWTEAQMGSRDLREPKHRQEPERDNGAGAHTHMLMCPHVSGSGMSSYPADSIGSGQR